MATIESRFTRLDTHQENFDVATGLYDQHEGLVQELGEQANTLRGRVAALNAEMLGFEGERTDAVVGEWRTQVEGFKESYTDQARAMMMVKQLTHLVRTAISDLESFPTVLPAKERLDLYGTTIATYNALRDVQRRQLDILRAVNEKLGAIEGKVHSQMVEAAKVVMTAISYVNNKGMAPWGSYVPFVGSPQLYEDAKALYASSKQTEVEATYTSVRHTIKPSEDGASVAAFREVREAHAIARASSGRERASSRVSEGSAGSGGAIETALLSMLAPQGEIRHTRTSYETAATEARDTYKAEYRSMDVAGGIVSRLVHDINIMQVEIERRGGIAAIPTKELEGFRSKLVTHLLQQTGVTEGRDGRERTGGLLLLERFRERLDALHAQHELKEISKAEMDAFRRMDPKFAEAVAERDTAVHESWLTLNADKSMDRTLEVLRHNVHAIEDVTRRDVATVEKEIARLTKIIEARPDKTVVEAPAPEAAAAGGVVAEEKTA